MSLEAYWDKRDFAGTPEPKGRAPKTSRSRQARFVVQMHGARKLHYDFRLEIDGVLKSWSVPKGPSLNPKDKRLAVATEDHPVEYAQFEGEIPHGHYGAGRMIIWDRGTWEPVGDGAEGLAKGKLAFRLQGERLQGQWTLVKMKGARASGKEWLLLKEDDETADPQLDLVATYLTSVASGRTLEEVALEQKSQQKRRRERNSHSQSESQTKTSAKTKTKSKSKSNRSNQAHQTAAHTNFDRLLTQLQSLQGAKPAPFPEPFAPQLASLYDSAPKGENWLHEIKFDGYRILTYCDEQVRLISRNLLDWSDKFAGLLPPLEKNLPQCVLDGEVVVLDEQGVSHFQKLQNALKGRGDNGLHYFLFDLPYLLGHDLTSVPLLERKRLLAQVVELMDHPSIRFSDHIEGGGEAVIEHACVHGLEGIISKRADSLYHSERTPHWRKIKCGLRQELIVIGFTEPKGTRVALGALLLGYFEEGRLRYAGKVGTGFSQETLRTLHKQLKPLVRSKTQAVGLDAAETRGATWVQPELVAEVAFAGWTDAGRVRQASYLGLREDKPASRVVREQQAHTPGSRAQSVQPSVNGAGDTKDMGAAPSPGKTQTTGKPKAARAQAEVAGVTISHPDKILFPDSAISKEQVAAYYASVADQILPFLVNRPLSLVRCPDGRSKHCFFQKHLHEGFSHAVKGIMIDESSGRREYAYVEDLQGLIGLVQMGTLEIHAWGSRIEDVEHPDMLVMDLDPDESVQWHDVKFAAQEVRDLLADLGLLSFVRTTGGKGLHLVIPVQPTLNWTQAKAFCQALAQRLVRQNPAKYTATASKEKRVGKIYLDYLRNARGATSIASYSTRIKPMAPIATPLAWSELADLTSAQQFRLDNLHELLQSRELPAWDAFFEVRQTLTETTMARLGVDTAPERRKRSRRA